MHILYYVVLCSLQEVVICLSSCVGYTQTYLYLRLAHAHRYCKSCITVEGGSKWSTFCLSISNTCCRKASLQKLSVQFMCHPFPHDLINSMYSTPWCVVWVCIHVFCFNYVRCMPKSAYALHIQPLLITKNSTYLCEACKNFNYAYIPMLFFTTYTVSCGN